MEYFREKKKKRRRKRRKPYVAKDSGWRHQLGIDEFWAIGLAIRANRRTKFHANTRQGWGKVKSTTLGNCRLTCFGQARPATSRWRNNLAFRYRKALVPLPPPSPSSSARVLPQTGCMPAVSHLYALLPRFYLARPIDFPYGGANCSKDKSCRVFSYDTRFSPSFTFAIMSPWRMFRNRPPFRIATWFVCSLCGPIRMRNNAIAFRCELDEYSRYKRNTRESYCLSIKLIKGNSTFHCCLMSSRKIIVCGEIISNNAAIRWNFTRDSLKALLTFMNGQNGNLQSILFIVISS